MPVKMADGRVAHVDLPASGWQCVCHGVHALFCEGSFLSLQKAPRVKDMACPQGELGRPAHEEREVGGGCRERASSMYGTVPYVLALGWVEVPYILAQTALFVPVAYFMVQLPDR